jgi:diphthamide biosynthesis protein 2
MSRRRQVPPPQLVFDDGSRAMLTEDDDEAGAGTCPRDETTSIAEYYELNRIANDIATLSSESQNAAASHVPPLRVAIQFPDNLLKDAAQVCWELEDTLATKFEQSPLVFCLGDTTVGSCCADEVAALHLNADVLVHYGHACLSPTGRLPVIYSFGKSEIDINRAVACLQKEISSVPKKLLLIYELGYHHAIEDFVSQLEGVLGVSVMTGQIPSPIDLNRSTSSTIPTRHSCCSSSKTSETPGACCRSEADTSISNEHHSMPHRFQVGGLVLPPSIESWEEVADYTVLYVGNPSSNNRQYTNVMLRLLSLQKPPEAFWSYSPKESRLLATLPPSLHQQLKRRFYLTQRARDANVFGILVSSLSQKHVIQVVEALRKRIDMAGRASYSFAVGKINPAKLANFAEIECFVLVACSEHSLLSNEREYHVPVITPLELDIALGNLGWGEQEYSLDCHDILARSMTSAGATQEDLEGSDEDDPDAPYFSLVTGKYESSTTSKSMNKEPLDLEALPGQGQVTEYKSEAAAFLKQREYQGLETLAGKTEAKAAISGQRGIASDYGGV